ncbi:hypothetical protein V8C35DRAFT_298800 [Trichoderma chlorosporum]
MAAQYDDSPELAEGHDLPEAYVSPPAEQVWSPQPSVAPTYASQTPVPYGNETYANTGAYSTTGTYSEAGKSAPVGAVGGVTGGVTGGVPPTDAGVESAYNAPGSIHNEKKAAAIGGVSLVLILSIIIGILAAAVIGLAVGTGISTNNYNKANSQLAVLSSSLAAAQATSPPSGTSTGSPTSSSASPSGTATFNSLTNGCSEEPNSVTGEIYTSAFFGKPQFTMYCDKDTNNGALYSVFATDFNGCMDACAGWNSYNTSTKGTCVAVSFIPSWSIEKNAVAGGAPGDCYLKPGTASTAILKTANIGTECHAAVLVKSS